MRAGIILHVGNARNVVPSARMREGGGEGRKKGTNSRQGFWGFPARKLALESKTARYRQISASPILDPYLPRVSSDT